MASAKAVNASLKMLSRVFAGVVDDAKVEVYAAALESLTDAQLAAATTIVIKSHTGEFIPPPAVLIKAVAPVAVAVDASSIIRKIEKLGTYSPHVGMIYPSVDRVRDELGETIAYAYASAGRDRVFSEDQTSRDIATREFSKAIGEAAARPIAALPIIGSEPSKPRLVRGDP